MEKPLRRRVYLFITRESGPFGQVLILVPSDPRREAETPGGTIEDGESPASAALREAEEETGLGSFAIPVLLAEDDHENRDERLRRFFFHLPALGPTVDVWTQRDGDGGAENSLRWIDLPEASGLHPHFRAYLERVRVAPPSEGA